VTFVLSNKYLGPVIGNETLRDARWSTIFFANSHFNSLKVDYFGTGTSSPLLQHYWSLAVEEQFYIVWPVLLLLIVLFFNARSSQVLLAVLSVTTFLSFISIFITEPALTYFATQTRIWELGIGAIMALVGSKQAPKVMQWIALIVLFGSLYLIDLDNKIPGFVILPILLATAALLDVSDDRLKIILGNRVMHYLGDLSFVLYLWHWPIIELQRQLGTSELTTNDSLSLLVIIFLMAVMTHHLIENPIRFSKYLASRPGVTVVSGSTALIFSILATYFFVKG
jgi:peptidoglycan/LPS O-acetylase OafA/YrhL